MKKKLLSMLMLVSLLVTAMPTAFTAAEGDVTKTFTTIFHSAMDEEKTALDGVEFRIDITDGNHEGKAITEYNTDGTCTCAITYNGDMFVYEYEEQEEGEEQPTHYRYEYPYLRVVTYRIPDGYDTSTIDVLYTVDEFIEMVGENDGSTAYYPVDTFEKKFVDYGECDDTYYEIYREYYNEKYGNTSVYFESIENVNSAKLVEALNCLDKAKDTCLNLYVTAYEYGEGFPTISAEAMAILNEYDAFVRIEKDGAYEEVHWWPTSSDNAFELAVAENASVTEGLDAAKIPYVLFSAKGMEGSEELVFYYGIEGGILADGTYREDDGSYEDIKCLYYYDTTNKIFKLCDEEVGYYCVKDMETQEYDDSKIIYKGVLPISGYYVIVDQLLPDLFTTIPKEEPLVPTPGEGVEEDDKDVSISQPIADSKEVIELEAEAGVVPEGAQLSVEKISEGETYVKAETALESIVTEKTEVHLFDITLLDSENVKIQPDGKVTITIALEETLEANEKVTVYRIEDDGTKTLMEGTKVVDGKVVFTTDHFSTYAVLVGEIVTVPKTGDVTTAGIYMLLLVAGAALLYVNKKQLVKQDTIRMKQGRFCPAFQ